MVVPSSLLAQVAQRLAVLSLVLPMLGHVPPPLVPFHTLVRTSDLPSEKA